MTDVDKKLWLQAIADMRRRMIKDHNEHAARMVRMFSMLNTGSYYGPPNQQALEAIGMIASMAKYEALEALRDVITGMSGL